MKTNKERKCYPCSCQTGKPRKLLISIQIILLLTFYQQQLIGGKKTQDRIAVWPCRFPKSSQSNRLQPKENPNIGTGRRVPDARLPVDEVSGGFGCAMAALERREGTSVNGGGDTETAV
jgi:hypothetical protein